MTLIQLIELLEAEVAMNGNRDVFVTTCDGIHVEPDGIHPYTDDGVLLL